MHDPLCLAADGEPCINHGTPACPCDCQCNLIAKVRADQDRIYREEMQSLVLEARKYA